MGPLQYERVRSEGREGRRNEGEEVLWLHSAFLFDLFTTSLMHFISSLESVAVLAGALVLTFSLIVDAH